MAISFKVAWVLGLALIGTNAWWMHSTKEEDIRCANTIDQLWSYDSAQLQMMKILPVSARPGSTKEDVVKVALDALPGVSAEDHGNTVKVGAVVLEFNENGRVVGVEPLNADELAKSYKR